VIVNRFAEKRDIIDDAVYHAGALDSAFQTVHRSENFHVLKYRSASD
jgi:hypothetical protein